MKMIQSLTAVAVAAVMLNSFATPVFADEVKAESEANAEVTCETGTYGQNVNCKAKSSSSAKAIIKRDGVSTHTVANTGLDGQGIALALGTVATGVAATVARVRIK